MKASFLVLICLLFNFKLKISNSTSRKLEFDKKKIHEKYMSLLIKAIKKDYEELMTIYKKYLSQNSLKVINESIMKKITIIRNLDEELIKSFKGIPNSDEKLTTAYNLYQSSFVIGYQLMYYSILEKVKTVIKNKRNLNYYFKKIIFNEYYKLLKNLKEVVKRLIPKEKSNSSPKKYEQLTKLFRFKLRK